ncbi:MAG: hypothetical protein IKS51_01970 [Erysipelotrichaceae bacterium]|nr:hypothetical protein [Erysipelotrichaceae bacterium]
MFKKLLLLILLLCLSCTKTETIEPDDKEYIEAMKDVLLFDEIDAKLQDRLQEANNGSYYQNYQFQMLFQDAYDGTLTDINGNPFRFDEHEKVWLEIVSVNCGHCQNQLSYVNEILEYEDAAFVQYFNVGTKEEIISLYAQQDLEIPEKLTVISRDDDFRKYITDTLHVKVYPTLIAYDQGKVSFVNAGEMEMETLPAVYEIGFVDKIRRSELVTEKGEDLLSINRSMDDVEASLSEENRKKLSELDHDGKTRELTLSMIGKAIDYKKYGANSNSTYIDEVKDFTSYQEKKTVFIYTYLRDNSETEEVEFINELIHSDENYDYVVILMEGLESSSAALRHMDVSFDAPVVSSLARVPADLLKFGLVSYPTAIFADEGVFTGCYSEIENVDNFKKALQLFLSDESLAYKKNN